MLYGFLCANSISARKRLQLRWWRNKGSEAITGVVVKKNQFTEAVIRNLITQKQKVSASASLAVESINA